MRAFANQLLHFLSNILKYSKNAFRIFKLRRKGARIGRNVVIGKGFQVTRPKKLTVGNNIYIGEHCFFDCSGGLTIHDGTIISNHCTIMSFNHDYAEGTVLPYGLRDIEKEVVIHRNCWIGIHVNLCPGVEIGENAVIGMGTTVSKNVSGGTVFAGGKTIKERPAVQAKYSLLEIRTLYNPLHYLRFQPAVSRAVKHAKTRKAKTISFRSIHSLYPGEDWLSLLFRYCQFSDIEMDLKNECIVL